MVEEPSCALALLGEAISKEKNSSLHFNFVYYKKRCRKYLSLQLRNATGRQIKKTALYRTPKRMEWEVFHLCQQIYSLLIVAWHFDPVKTDDVGSFVLPVIVKLILQDFFNRTL